MLKPYQTVRYEAICLRKLLLRWATLTFLLAITIPLFRISRKYVGLG